MGTCSGSSISSAEEVLGRAIPGRATLETHGRTVMFEAAELGRALSKAEYRREEARLRPALLDVQRRLLDRKFSVIILLGGVDGAGKGETVNQLSEWLDP